MNGDEVLKLNHMDKPEQKLSALLLARLRQRSPMAAAACHARAMLCA